MEVQARQLKATSPDLTLNGDSYRKWYQHGLRLGIETVVKYPVQGDIIDCMNTQIRGP